MKLKSTFVVHQIADSQIMVPTGESADRFQGFLRSNETAAYIVENIIEDTTKDELVNRLVDRYDVDLSVANEAVDYVINVLKSVDALED